jgi:dihydroorotate dehydrogenase (fumarate)
MASEGGIMNPYQVELAGIQLEHPIIPAAGWCKDQKHVEELARSTAAAVMLGSFTVLDRMGNSGDVYHSVPNLCSINSLGIPNRGKEFMQVNLALFAEIARLCDKPLFASVAGFSPEDYAELTVVVDDSGVALEEINLSCPNIWNGAIQKPVICYDPQATANVLDALDSVAKYSKLVFSAKLSPIPDRVLLSEIAAILASYAWIKVVTAINTYPNAFLFNGKGKAAITPAGGLAGLSGPALKPIALGMVMQLVDFLPKRIAVMAAGGVQSGQDVVDYQNAGAVVIQVGTALFNEQPKVFDRILTEYIDLKQV